MPDALTERGWPVTCDTHVHTPRADQRGGRQQQPVPHMQAVKGAPNGYLLKCQDALLGLSLTAHLHRCCRSPLPADLAACRT